MLGANYLGQPYLGEGFAGPLGPIAGTGASSITLSGLATGASIIVGTAASTTTLSALGTGTVALSATAASGVTLSGLATGHVGIASSAASAVSLSGLATVSPPVVATAATGATLGATATGVVVIPASGAGSLGLSALGVSPSPGPRPFDGLALFITPQVRDRPPYLPDSSRREVMLMRHFENRLRGVLVWERNDGTYCVDTTCNYEAAMTEPAAYLSQDPIGPDLTADFAGLNDSNVNYPWNPYPASTNSTIPGSFAYNVNWDQSTQDFILDPYMIQWWQGGAENVITQAQALALTAAGFGDCISAAPPGAEIGSQPQGQGPYGSSAINA